jgi:Molecular chaperone
VGSRFSGVAYATESEFLAKNISVISEWPGCGRDEGKAPTELLYEHEDSWWGYDLPDVGDPIRWFKLLLLNNEDLQEGVKSSAFYLAAKEKVRRENLKPVDLVADYLRFQWKHALEVIEKSRGDQFLPSLRFHIVITVPAIWKGYARQSMQEAAEKAGIMAPRDIGKTRLSFVLEPEAAAMATLTDPEHQSLVKPGKTWLILDAGGGTVVSTYAYNIIVDLRATDMSLTGSHQLQITSTNPITMDEAVEGTGELPSMYLEDLTHHS